MSEFGSGAWPVEIGRTYEVRFPFKTEEYHPPIDEGPESGGTFCMPPSRPTWVPGWKAGETYYGERNWCEGWGAELRTVVSIHRPGKYPERVFYVRQWRDPDGRVFGKKGLRIVASRDFRTWATGRRYHRTFSRMTCETPIREDHP